MPRRKRKTHKFCLGGHLPLLGILPTCIAAASWHAEVLSLGACWCARPLCTQPCTRLYPRACSIEQMQLLSKLERSGVLSTLERSGIDLAFIEKNKLLSKAEDFGAVRLLSDRCDLRCRLALMHKIAQANCDKMMSALLRQSKTPCEPCMRSYTVAKAAYQSLQCCASHAGAHHGR